MKKLLLLVPLILLAVSADSQAMMRRAPARIAPIVQRTQQRPFSFKKEAKQDLHEILKNIRENKFPLPKLPAHRVNQNLVEKHKDLCFDWHLANKRCNEERREINQAIAKGVATLIAAPIATIGMMYVSAVGFKMGLPDSIATFGVYAALISGIGGGSAYATGNIIWAGILKDFLKDYKNKQDNIETELADLAAEQKRELKLRDDIQ